ncbi:hypothetical protein [Baekduia sp. Peel2402]|uniref:hypothetical protein n=1 Tax=Baekduia sp. Peel2402 TaxID=3458296 RepID=UPI00403EEC58
MTVFLLACVVLMLGVVVARRRHARTVAVETDALGQAIAGDVDSGHADPLLPHPEVRAMLSASESRIIRRARPWLTVCAWFGGRMQLEDERSERAPLMLAEAEAKSEAGGVRNWRSNAAARTGRVLLVLLATALGAVLAEPALSTLGFSDQALPVVAVLVAGVFAALFAVAFRINGAIRADLGRADLSDADRVLIRRRRRWVFGILALAIPALAATAICREHNTRIKAAQETAPLASLCEVGTTAGAPATLSSGPKAARTSSAATSSEACAGGEDGQSEAPWAWWMAVLELPVLATLALAESLSGAASAARDAERRRRRLSRQAHRHRRRWRLRLLVTDMAYRQLDLLVGQERRALAERLDRLDASYCRARKTPPEGRLAWPDELVADPYGDLLLHRLTTPPETVVGLRTVPAIPLSGATGRGAARPPKVKWNDLDRPVGRPAERPLFAIEGPASTGQEAS